MYVGVFAVGIAGVLLSRFRASGLAVTMAAVAPAQVVVTVIALAAGLGGDNPRIELIGLNGMFIAPFGTSAWLFRRAGTSLPRDKP